MSLDVLELIVHNNLHVRCCRNIFAEEGRIFLKGFGLDLADGFAAFRDIALEFMTRLLMLADF